MDREEPGGLQSMGLKKDLVTKQQKKQFRTRNETVLVRILQGNRINRITIPIDIYLSTCVCVYKEIYYKELAHMIMKLKVAQSCPTLCNPMDYTPWNSLGQNIGVGTFSLLQGISPTQRLNPGLPHCRQILYQLSHKGGWQIPRSAWWVGKQDPLQYSCLENPMDRGAWWAMVHRVENRNKWTTSACAHTHTHGLSSGI